MANAVVDLTNDDKYFCHVCAMEVCTSLEGSEVSCTQCNRSFVEKVNPSDPPLFHNVVPLFNSDSDSDSEDGMEIDERQLSSAMGRFFGSFLGDLDRYDDRASNSLASNPGNYAFGNVRFDSILHQLFQGAGTSGAPPTSKSVIESLPVFDISTENLKSGSVECVVCKDDLGVGDKCTELPCKHLFHPQCIKPWLQRHNTCPICRGEISK